MKLEPVLALPEAPARLLSDRAVAALNECDDPVRRPRRYPGWRTWVRLGFGVVALAASALSVAGLLLLAHVIAWSLPAPPLQGSWLDRPPSAFGWYVLVGLSWPAVSALWFVPALQRRLASLSGRRGRPPSFAERQILESVRDDIVLAADRRDLGLDVRISCSGAALVDAPTQSGFLVDERLVDSSRRRELSGALAHLLGRRTGWHPSLDAIASWLMLPVRVAVQVAWILSELAGLVARLALAISLAVGAVWGANQLTAQERHSDDGDGGWLALVIAVLALCAWAMAKLLQVSFQLASQVGKYLAQLSDHQQMRTALYAADSYAVKIGHGAELLAFLRFQAKLAVVPEEVEVIHSRIAKADLAMRRKLRCDSKPRTHRHWCRSLPIRRTRVTAATR